MRNLCQYPITANEKLARLDDMIEAETTKLNGEDAPVGDPFLAILQSIKADVIFASDEYNQRIVRNHKMASSMQNMASQMSAEIAPR